MQNLVPNCNGKGQTDLVNAGFLPCDQPYCVTQYGDVIKTQGGNTSNYWLRDYVCTVIRAPDTDLENGSIDLADRLMDDL